jgi:hypothetical protein
MLLGSIPAMANDPQYCTSRLYLDGFTENFRVQTLLRLTHPNKELGGTDVFVLSTSLLRFLGTVRIMLASIKLQPSEIGLFKIPNDQNIITAVLEGLTGIRERVDDLQKQFEGMR